MYGRAEQERLLYVAATRARQFLVVSWYPSKPEKGAWTNLSPYLGAVEELEAPTVADHAVAGGQVTLAHRSIWTQSV